MKALVILLLLAGVAEAESTHDRLLGFRMVGGTTATRDFELGTIGLGLAIERVSEHWRVTAEYEYLWVDASELEGNAHRAHVGLRRTMLESLWLIEKGLKLYVDGELGVGLMVASIPMTDTFALPHAFAGLRVGYTAISSRTQASQVWQPELFVRAIGTYDLGWIVGFGFHWGD